MIFIVACLRQRAARRLSSNRRQTATWRLQITNQTVLNSIFRKLVVGDRAESTKERTVYDASVRPHPEAPSLNAALSALQNKLWNVLVCTSFHPEDFLQVRKKEAKQEPQVSLGT